MKYPRVLVATPHADRKNYCLPQFLEVLESLSYPNMEILVVDNSESRKNLKMFVKKGIRCIHVKPRQKSNIKYVCESHNEIRDYAIRNNFPLILHLESDIIPPPNIIEQLLAHKKKVVGATYFIAGGDNSHLVNIEIEKEGVSTRLTKRMLEANDFNFVDGTLKQVHSTGLGCILIHTDIFERVPFRFEEGIDAHPDTFFALDLQELGIPIFCDTSIICQHNNTEWTDYMKV